MKQLKYIFLLIIATGLFVSCEDDLLDTTPADSLSAEQVAAAPGANAAIINGIYANLRSWQAGSTTAHVDYGHKGLISGFDMMAQDIVLNNFNWYIFFYNFNGRQQTSTRTLIAWVTYYSEVANANIVINNLNTPEKTLTEEEEHLLGQAFAIKSFCLFNLVRIYGHTYLGHENDPGVPIPNRIEFEPGKPRGTIQDVYDQIIPDLEKALTLLDGFSRGSKQQINKEVAHGILANVYLETGNWALAAQNAAAARTGSQLMPGNQWATDGFDQISNVEWMWGADIDSESTTVFPSFFSHFDSRSSGYAGGSGGHKLIDARLYNQIPDSDLRKAAWISPINNDSGLPDYTNVKFVDATGSFEGDYVYMRSAEMYLIEAEAKARLGDATAADVLFELVSNRNPDYIKSTNTGDALVEEIYLQRRIELWGEGVSWFDLKRLKKPLDRTSGDTNHKTFGQIDIEAEGNFFRLQIPEDELNSNENINVADQNPS